MRHQVADVEVGQLFLETSSGVGDELADPAFQSFIAQPHLEAGTGVVARQSDRFEEDAQQGEPDAVLGLCPQVAGGGVQPTVALGRIREFFEEVFHAGRQLGQAPGLGTVRELEVGPEVLEHLDQMRLAGAEEAADPHARLLALIQVAKVGAEDAAQPFRILAVAYEVREFVPQGVEFSGRLPAGDFGDTLIEQRVGTRVFLVNLKVHHDGRTSASLAVIGTAR